MPWTSIFLITLNIRTKPISSMVTTRPPLWRYIWTNKGVVIDHMVCGDTEVYSAVQTKVSTTLSVIMWFQAAPRFLRYFWGWICLLYCGMNCEETWDYWETKAKGMTKGENTISFTVGIVFSLLCNKNSWHKIFWAHETITDLSFSFSPCCPELRESMMQILQMTRMEENGNIVKKFYETRK